LSIFPVFSCLTDAGDGKALADRVCDYALKLMPDTRIRSGLMQISEVPSRKPVIAVVGLSDRPTRASHEVSAYMQRHGYRIVAINPMYAGSTILGEHCYASLSAAAEAVAGAGERIDIVNCFRRAEDIPPIMDEAIAIGANCIWMQLDIVNEAAAARAREAGLQVIMDRCIKIEHAMGRMHGVL
jgi:predicted CoA-binding protein